MPSTASLALDAIEARFRAAGVVPPDDRAEGTYANAQRLLSLMHWLRRPRGMADEPAHIMTLEEWTK